MPTLLLADHDGQALSGHTAKALNAARQMGEVVDVLVTGSPSEAVLTAVAALAGIREILVAQTDRLAETDAATILSLADEYSGFVSAASSHGKSVMPRVAALLDVMQISEVIAVLGGRRYRRPVYAGNAIQTLESTDSRQVVTVRTTAFAAAPSTGETPRRAIATSIPNQRSRIAAESLTGSLRAELTAARVVVAGGRGLGSKAQFEQLLLPLADKLGAALGASRAAVDAGYAPNDWQVGQTGKVVAPDLYIAVGISGAIQHLAGIKDAKVIVAINKDQDAPIFQIADYGLVGDLFVIVPELERLL